ncbi:reverse transcriptase domain-containing protein [Tanacetum coccineum]
MLKCCIKKSDFVGTEEVEKALTEMEKLVVKLPTLTVPIEGESMVMYVSVVEEAVIADLLAERGNKQIPIYFVGRALQSPETNYTPMEKLILALVHVARRLRAALILTSPDKVEFTYALYFEFKASNNEAKYEAFLARLRIAVPRSQNKQASALNKMASVSFAHLMKKLLVEVLPCKSIEEIEVMAVVEETGSTWMTPIKEYLENRTLPEEKGKAWRLRERAMQYVLLEGTLYQKSFLGPWLRYVGPEQANYMIREIHKGSCSMHSGPMSVVTKAMQLGFGLPGEIISDNRKQFRDEPFKTWCEKLSITQHFATVKHPQSNELVERANRSLDEGIKAWLGKDNKDWVEEFPYVLWAYQTMVKSSNENTLFSLTYDTEAVIPVKIGMSSLRCSMVDKNKNDEGLLLNLNLLQERRELAVIAEEKHKRKMEGYYNSKVWSNILRLEDLVYHNNEASKKEDTGKLGPKWEGPYEVTEALRDGAYKLWDQEGNQLPRTWNITDLK